MEVLLLIIVIIIGLLLFVGLPCAALAGLRYIFENEFNSDLFSEPCPSGVAASISVFISVPIALVALLFSGIAGLVPVVIFFFILWGLLWPIIKIFFTLFHQEK